MFALVLAFFTFFPVWSNTEYVNSCNLTRVEVVVEAPRYLHDEIKDTCRMLCSVGHSCYSKGYAATTFSKRQPYLWGVTCWCGDGD
jgi:hypothetical protein